MTEPSYPQCLTELYHGEAHGEAFALTVLACTEDPEQIYKWGTLLQLETETKARLRPLLVEHGLALLEPEPPATLAAVAESYRSKDWRTFVAETCPFIEGFVARFEALEAAAPPAGKDVLRSMVAHERAILEFFVAERDGRPQGSAAAMAAQLAFPLPNPNGY